MTGPGPGRAGPTNRSKSVTGPGFRSYNRSLPVPGRAGLLSGSVPVLRRSRAGPGPFAHIYVQVWLIIYKYVQTCMQNVQPWCIYQTYLYETSIVARFIILFCVFITSHSPLKPLFTSPILSAKLLRFHNATDAGATSPQRRLLWPFNPSQKNQILPPPWPRRRRRLQPLNLLLQLYLWLYIQSHLPNSDNHRRLPCNRRLNLLVHLPS